MIRVANGAAPAVVLLCLACLSFPAPALAEGGSTLTVGLLSEPATLNPLVSTSAQTKDILERIYIKLLDEKDDFLNFNPRLARRWEYGPDSLSVTFYLRDDVRWTDGVPVTAEDVRFTWELEVDTLVAWPSSGIKSSIRDVEVVDTYTVSFHFTRRYPSQLMDANDGVILPKHVLGDVPRGELRTHEFGRSPVGCGPFKLGRWEAGRFIELVRNENYYENGKPYVDRVIFKFVPDMVTLTTQLKKGEIDVLESIPADLGAGLTEKYPNLKIYTYPSRQYVWIAWNVRHELFKDAEIRRALTMAVNRDEIIETLFGGLASECKSPIHSNLWAFDDGIEPLPYAPDSSRSVLGKHGWTDGNGDGILDKDGKPFQFEMMTNSGNQLRVDIVTMAEAYLEKVGVKVVVRTLEFGTVVDALLSGGYESCVFGWRTATKPDITNEWHSSSLPRKGMNVSFYQNPEVDALIDEAKVTLDQTRAKELWSRVQRIIYYDQPFTFVAIPHEVNAVDKRFCNIRPNAISFFYNLREWRTGGSCP